MRVIESNLLTKIAMTRRCSHCAQQNHNSRTCPERGVRLFGVRIHDQQGAEMSESMRKSVSMGNLSNYSGGTTDSMEPGEEDRGAAAADGYLSDGLVHGARDRKRGEERQQNIVSSSVQ